MSILFRLYRGFLFSFSASLRLLLYMEVYCSMMYMLDCGLRIPLHIWKEIINAWYMTVQKYCHLLQQWDWKFILISRLFWLISWGLYLSHFSLQLPIYLSLRYANCFISGLSSKRQSMIIIYIWVYKGRYKPHCFLLFSIYNFIACAWLIMLYNYETLHPIDR